ncbi:MAG: [FeFe] hydrogenase H-cluster radical SAM maturase HydE [Bacteroidetes bacterium]|nr:[FeFe] hydrogenase H-cluster radical SAM maturase HydE [Bacteroidota bacterium]
MTTVYQILSEERFDKESIVTLLKSEGNDKELLFVKAAEVKHEYIGNMVHLRGLIELTNQCSKNCFYCGIGASNKKLQRFMISLPEVEEAIQFSYNNNYGSIVIQTGEIQSESFTQAIEDILFSITKIGNGKLGVTLSCGEQSIRTYRRWKAAGAHRYLLRIESSNKELYYKLHPNNKKHNYDIRLEALKNLQKCGYQTGTGVMIGLPFQTIENLADDLLFMRDLNIDMCGMGPYIEHVDTELYKYKDLVPTKEARVDLSLKMIAILRIMMKDINIAATTAMQTLVDGGREMALVAGANILMPNTTPGLYREQYALYNDKPGINEEAEDSKQSIEKLIYRAGCVIAYGEMGNSRHFLL